MWQWGQAINCDMIGSLNYFQYEVFLFPHFPAHFPALARLQVLHKLVQYLPAAAACFWHHKLPTKSSRQTSINKHYVILKKSPEYNAKYILDIPKDMSYLFKASALWADAFKMSMCLFVCLFVCVFTFEVPFKRLFAPSLVAGLEGWVVKPMFDTLEKSKRTQARLNTAGRNSTQFRNSN